MATKFLNFSSGSNSNSGNTAALPYLTNAYTQTQTSSQDTVVIIDNTYTSITDSYTWPADRIYMSQTYYNYTLTGVLPAAGITAAVTAIIDAASVAGRKFYSDTIGANTYWYGIWIKNFNYGNANYPAVDMGDNRTTGSSNFTTCILSGLRSGSVTDARNSNLVGAGILANKSYNISFIGCLFYDNDYNSAGANASSNGLFGLNNVNASTASATLTLKNCTIDISGYTYLQRLIGISTSGITLTLNWINNLVYNSGASIVMVNDVTTMNAAFARGTGSSTNSTYGFTSNPSTTYFDLTSDPLFVDASTRNYSLKVLSPAIDSGTVI